MHSPSQARRNARRTRVTESTVNESFAAFKSGNSMGKLVILPVIGMDSDRLFCKANVQSTWREPVPRFLGTLDLHRIRFKHP